MQDAATNCRSPMSPPLNDRGPSLDIPLVQPTGAGFRASFHFQNTRSYENLSTRSYTSCMVCGRSVNDIQEEKINWYMQKSTPGDEPDCITMLRSIAYINGLNAGSLLFVTPAVSRAAARDGT